jgi:FlaA1/EpsC-like NDP-sugar epimerase
MRNRHFLLLDILGLLLVPIVVLAIRFEGLSWPAGYLEVGLVFALVTIPLRIWIAWRMGLYRCLWRHASIVELERILAAALIIGVTTFVLGALVLPGTGLLERRMPYVALALDAVLTLLVLSSSRLGVRYLYARARRTVEGVRTIVVGAGSAGQAIAREGASSPRAGFTIVGFVDDDARKQGLMLSGIRVEGRIDEIPRLARELAAAEVIIAIPSARGGVVRRIVEMCTAANIRTRTVPSLADLYSGRVSVTSLRPVEIQDLLGREPIITDLSAVKTLATGRVVMVTGAGGSIGGELSRQIADLRPELLVVLDHSENQVFEIERELLMRAPTLKVAPVIADIRDVQRVQTIFARYRPFAVFHAAAHKHVPLMEENIVEAVTNNVIGTRNVLDASVECGVTHFVLISTDKAVRPTSVMGASKRAAEVLVRLAAAREKGNFVSVRFGNVLGSRGSVVPTFMAQIARGGPITVTHPEMRRFFMTIPEAVQLVLQAGALGTGGELFVLDMGEAVRISDLARDLIRLSGLEEGVDIEITYTGVRPGEKLYEEVFHGHEEVLPTAHPKVLRVAADEPADHLEERLAELIRLVSLVPDDAARLREALRRVVPEYTLPESADAKIISLDARRNTGEQQVVG